MTKDNGFEITSLNPGWIKRRVPNSYADDGLRRIIMFYVINTPCSDLSSSSIPTNEYGWDKNVWRHHNLKNKLFAVASLERNSSFGVAKNVSDMKSVCQKIGMKKKFHDERTKEKIVIYKPPRYNEFMAILYHIRNALAHGRLAMYPIEDGKDIMFALEDGIKRNAEFQVRSRMLLKKTTLLKWIDIIEKKEKT